VIAVAALAGLAGAVSGRQPSEGEQPAAVTAVRHWSLSNLTRVAVEVGGNPEFYLETLYRPDRLVLNIKSTRLRFGHKGTNVLEVGDHLVKQIRVAQYDPTTTRVVLDLEGPVAQEVTHLANPSRLVLEVRPASKPADTASRGQTGPEKPPAADPPALTKSPNPPASSPARPSSSESVVSQAEVRPPAPANTERPADARSPNPPSSSPVKPPGTGSTERRTEARTADPPPRNPAASDPAPLASPQGASGKSSAPAGNNVELAAAKPAGNQANGNAASPAPAKTESAAPADPSRDVPRVTAPPPPAPAPKIVAGRPGAANSLTRALGLKLGRVVLDPGHGAHDHGTTGPTGLMEKELVLDVSQRLGTLIEERLGSEVVYTRSEDVFIPLDQRTAIANQHRADLFLSIHANSSPIRSISGAEVFYLNFATSKDAMEVAARENAGHDKSIFELRELVQKIALKEKLDESRDLASKVQSQLSTTWLKLNTTSRNRGVKRAPFVVLIGASMPSVLAEIGFVSNPKDEVQLKKPETRQKIAEALYKAIEQYVSAVGQTAVAQRSEGK
jgi:N-acetylmuramoyl-L-alanine amidase